MGIFLDAREKEIFDLRVCQGWSYKEVCRALNKDLQQDALRQRVTRMKKKIRLFVSDRLVNLGLPPLSDSSSARRRRR